MKSRWWLVHFPLAAYPIKYTFDQPLTEDEVRRVLRQQAGVRRLGPGIRLEAIEGKAIKL